MTDKEKMLHAVQDLPSDASYTDAMERILFLAKIEKGIQQADSGQVVAQAEAEKRMAKWLK